MKYQKPYRWKSRKIYGENKGWMGKIQENIGQTIQMTHFLTIFLPFRFLLEKQHRSVKNCPIFSKINFFISNSPNFAQISFSKSLFFFLRLDFATLNLPTGGRSSVPLTPLNGHSHSLVPMFPFLFFLAYLLRIFINNLIFIKTFINKFKKFLIKVLTRGKRYDIMSMWEDGSF